MKFKLLKLDEILNEFAKGKLLYCKDEKVSCSEIENNSSLFCMVQTPDYKMVCLRKIHINDQHPWEIAELDQLDFFHKLLAQNWFIKEEE